MWLWCLIGRCVKHFGAQVTDMIEFGSGAIVCRLPAGRQERCASVSCGPVHVPCAHLPICVFIITAFYVFWKKRKSVCTGDLGTVSRLCEAPAAVTFAQGWSYSNFELKSWLEQGRFFFPWFRCSKWFGISGTGNECLVEPPGEGFSVFPYKVSTVFFSTFSS